MDQSDRAGTMENTQLSKGSHLMQRKEKNWLFLSPGFNILLVCLLAELRWKQNVSQPKNCRWSDSTHIYYKAERRTSEG